MVIKKVIKKLYLLNMLCLVIAIGFVTGCGESFYNYYNEEEARELILNGLRKDYSQDFIIDEINEVGQINGLGHDFRATVHKVEDEDFKLTVYLRGSKDKGEPFFVEIDENGKSIYEANDN